MGSHLAPPIGGGLARGAGRGAPRLRLRRTPPRAPGTRRGSAPPASAGGVRVGVSRLLCLTPQPAGPKPGCPGSGANVPGR